MPPMPQMPPISPMPPQQPAATSLQAHAAAAALQPATGQRAGSRPQSGGWLSGESSLSIAISGLALVLFLVLHLAAVSLALVQPARFEGLAVWLHSRWWLAPLELILALALLLHPLLALSRTLTNRRYSSTVIGPRRSRRAGAPEALVALGGRWLPYSGALLLLFLGVHLTQLRWSRPPAGGERAALLAALDSPAALLLYGLAGLALALHLMHGNESAHRSLGLLRADNRTAIRWLGRGLALLLGGGFALLPWLLVLQSHWPLWMANPSR